MYLTKAEQRILDGEEGKARQLAMRLLVAIGDAYDASRMIKIKSSQVSGVSYKTIGDPGLEFLKEISSEGAVAKVRSMLNPAGMDLSRWRELGISEGFARKQLEIMQCFERMRIEPTCTCIPYHESNAPLRGEHVAWAESSAVVFANSVLGAHTNREGGPTALASSILGISPLYGMHLKENRLPTHLVRVKCKLNSELHYSLIGYWLGQNLESSIPRIDGTPKNPSHDKLKALCASMAASGNISMFSIGAARQHEVETVDVHEEELKDTIDLLSSDGGYEQVALGCPHLSLQEMKAVATMVSGKKMGKRLWCFTSRHIRNQAQRHGYVSSIERAGGNVICDTCIVVSPMTELGINGIVTNSCKAAHYLRSLSRVETRLMDLEECVKYALQ